MARPAKNLPVILKVEYVPCPADRVGAYRVGLRLLLDLLHEERDRLEQERANESTASEFQSGLCAPSPGDGGSTEG
jgi:hypothetical protein